MSFRTTYPFVFLIVVDFDLDAGGGHGLETGEIMSVGLRDITKENQYLERQIIETY